MKIWFVHQNFPGQYKHLAQHYAADSDNEVVTIGAVTRLEVPGAKQFTYKKPGASSKSTHAYLHGLENSVRRGQEAARLALKLKQDGLTPEIVCSHPGWGDSLYFKDIFPDAKFLSYFEYYYQAYGSDVAFDPEFSSIGLNDLARIRTKNTTNLLALEMADWGMSPTHWQKAQFPEIFQPRIGVVHDGIDTRHVCPDSEATVTFSRDDLTLSASDEVITYVSRHLEPYRGFHSFMRALPEIMRRRPKAHVLMVGADGVSYGKALPEGQSYRKNMLEEVGGDLDMSRVHFLGRVPYEAFLKVLQISSVHVYLTYPFVLSWSCLEAMSAGCAVVGSRTAPVEEVVRDGENGVLCDFFSPEDIATKTCEVLEDKEKAKALGAEARQTIIEHYDLKSVCQPRQIQMIENLVLNRPIGV